MSDRATGPQDGQGGGVEGTAGDDGGQEGGEDDQEERRVAEAAMAEDAVVGELEDPMA